MRASRANYGMSDVLCKFASDDMLCVKGINVFPSGIAEVLNTLVHDLTGDFQIVLPHPGPYDHLDINVEYWQGIRVEEMEALRRTPPSALL